MCSIVYIASHIHTDIRARSFAISFEQRIHSPNPEYATLIYESCHIAITLLICFIPSSSISFPKPRHIHSTVTHKNTTTDKAAFVSPRTGTPQEFSCKLIGPSTAIHFSNKHPHGVLGVWLDGSKSFGADFDHVARDLIVTLIFTPLTSLNLNTSRVPSHHHVRSAYKSTTKLNPIITSPSHRDHAHRARNPSASQFPERASSNPPPYPPSTLPQPQSFDLSPRAKHHHQVPSSKFQVPSSNRIIPSTHYSFPDSKPLHPETQISPSNSCPSRTPPRLTFLQTKHLLSPSWS